MSDIEPPGPAEPAEPVEPASSDVGEAPVIDKDVTGPGRTLAAAAVALLAGMAAIAIVVVLAKDVLG